MIRNVKSRRESFSPRLANAGGSTLSFALLLLALHASAATSANNPYSGIVERNGFGLKAPDNPADLVKPPAPVVADIKLQGISTILGRSQVLMKIKVPAKPPEPAREQSLVLGEGQREGEVEVKQINPAEGTVTIDNGGATLALNMKDHSERPSPGAAPPAAAGSGVIPTLPLPTGGSPAVPSVRSGIPAPIPASGGGAATFGNAGSSDVAGFGNTAATTALGQKALPSRTLRSTTGMSGTPGASTPQNANEFHNLSPEAQAILIEAQRTQVQAGGFDPLPKTVITPREHLGTPTPGQPK
jgi:hypothetical protein